MLENTPAQQGLSGVMLAQGYKAFQRLQTRKTDTRAALTVEQVDDLFTLAGGL